MVVHTRAISNLGMLLELMPKGRNFSTRVIRSLRQSAYLWDPWILKDDDVYRLFYLTTAKPDRSVPFWSQGSIGSAVSTDLKTWQSTGIALAPEPANLWESARMLAGSTYKEDGIYYLFYSASAGGDLLRQEWIGLATSTEGLNWKRYSPNPLFSVDDCSPWYGEEKDQGKEIEPGRFHWRDPYVVKDYSTGKYYMFICAYLKQGAPYKYRACVGLAVADKIVGPYKLLPPVASPTSSELEEWPFLEMERPQVIYNNGKYHLFFSCWAYNLNPRWMKKVDGSKITDSSLYWFVSDNLTGPFKPVVSVPTIKGSETTGLYGTNFFPLPDNPEEFMAIGWYHRLHTLQISPFFRGRFNNDSIAISRDWSLVKMIPQFHRSNND